MVLQVFEPCFPEKTRHTLVRPLLAVRWVFSRPLQTRLIPKFIPLELFQKATEYTKLPWIKYIPLLTYGQLFLFLPIIYTLIQQVYWTFVVPSCKQSGWCAFYALLYVFLLANKSNSVFAFLFGMSYERLVPYHNLATWNAVATGILHAYAVGNATHAASVAMGGGNGGMHIAPGSNMAGGKDPVTFFWYLWHMPEARTGVVLLASIIVLFLTSVFRFFRKYQFDLWLYLHFALIFNVFVFGFLHRITPMAAIVAWFGLDIVLRYVIWAGFMYEHKAQLKPLGDGLVEIRFKKTKWFNYHMGQFLRVAIPKISVTQFHPFTISSAPHEEYVTVHCKVLGNWTKKLAILAQKQQEVAIMIEGPYSSLSFDIEEDARYPMIICVGGGIGITPTRSIVSQLIHEHKHSGRKLNYLRAIWAVRDIEMAKRLHLPSIAGHGTLTDSDTEYESEGSVSDFNGLPSIEFDNMTEIDLENCEVDGEDTNEYCDFQSNIYMSKGISEDEAHIHSFKPGNHVFIGERPNMEAILLDAKHQALKLGVTRIPVVVCGPTLLVDSTAVLCRNLSRSVFEKEGVVFELHTEIFDY